MIELPDKNRLAELRRFFDDSGYDTDTLTKRLGAARPPAAGEEHRMLYRTRAVTAENAVIRLFLLGTSIDEATAKESIPKSILELCSKAGLLETAGGRVRACIVIVPIGGLLFASDAFRVLGTDKAADFVLPASTHSANFLRRLTMRTPVDSMLDLGCGCGIHALCAAEHSGKVVATDLSPAAVRYTEFNARLNGIDNIECLTGNLFEPVAGRRFDLIVSNPPFVMGPDAQFTYRDNPLELDEFCRQLIREAPTHLTEGSYLQMLCEWAEIKGQSWTERLSAWMRGIGCDAWILHSSSRDPASYVAQRSADISGTQPGSDRTYDDWVGYFEKNEVTAIHAGMIVSRRRNGQNWFHVQGIAGDVETDAGEAVLQGLAACDFLDLCNDDDSLLEATLRLAPELTLEQHFARRDNEWNPGKNLLRLAGSLPADAEVDDPVLAFLNQIDGQKTIRECIEKFSDITGAPSKKLTAELLPAVRLFIGRRYLEAADPDS